MTISGENINVLTICLFDECVSNAECLPIDAQKTSCATIAINDEL